jgi:hypothetical protein
MWKRLGVLLPAGALALTSAVWIAVGGSEAAALRIPAACIAALLGVLQGYLALRTWSVVRDRAFLPLQVARTRRREMRPATFVSAASILVLAGLLIVPANPPGAPAPIDPGPVVMRKPHARAEPETSHPPIEEDSAQVEPPGPATPEPPKAPKVPEPGPSPSLAPPSAPVAAEPPAAKAIPEIRPELALQPAHLALEDFELAAPNPILAPAPQKEPAAVAQDSPGPGEETSPFRIEPDRFWDRPSPASWKIGLLFRPLPDENDPESWPRPEGKVDGFLLLGGGDRVPGLTLALDLPFGRYDLIEVSWMAVDLPKAGDVDRGLSADWHHATLAYVRRLVGYTSHATTDVSVSLGVSVDLFGDVQGIPDPGGTPKFAPFAAVDVGFWQQEAVGLLLHLGQCFGANLFGSSLGMTDLSAQVRWDLTERISIHGGYRLMRLSYKPDDVSTPKEDRLHLGLSGPILGVDVRF